MEKKYSKLELIDALVQYNRDAIDNKENYESITGDIECAESQCEKIIHFINKSRKEKANRKISYLQKLLCSIGFHTFYVKQGTGIFSDGQCQSCLKFKSSNY